jgi:hypothetical protein
VLELAWGRGQEAAGGGGLAGGQAMPFAPTFVLLLSTHKPMTISESNYSALITHN